MFRTTLFTIAVAATVSMNANAQHTRLTVLHGIPNLPAPVEVFLDGANLFSFDYTDIEGPFTLEGGQTYAVAVQLQGQTVLSANVPLLPGRDYSAIAHLDPAGGIQLSLFDNDTSAITPGNSRVTIRHTAQAPAVDVGVDQGGSRVATFGPLTNPNEVVTEVPAATYDASIFLAGTTNLALGPIPLPLQEDIHYLVYAVGDASGPSFTVLLQTIDLSPIYSLGVAGTACGGAISTDVTSTTVGTPFQVFLSGASANANGALLYGNSNASVGGVPLPLDLTPIGAPGCTLFTNSQLGIPVSTNGVGIAGVTLTLPPGVGRFLDAGYFQYAFASNANPLGLAFTESVELIRQ